MGLDKEHNFRKALPIELSESGELELIKPAYGPIGNRFIFVSSLWEAGASLKSAVGNEEQQLISDPATDTAGVGWILAENWWPYQRPSFVTPPFPGYVSGHSTYSRGAAEVMTLLTGSPYFPDGLGEFYCPQNAFLVFEEGPSVDCTLQWASYADASDETSISRIYGGIHPRADDIPGRLMGAVMGPDSFKLAARHFNGQLSCPPNCGLYVDGVIDVGDLLRVLGDWGQIASPCDIDDNDIVDVGDLLEVLGAWGSCP